MHVLLPLSGNMEESLVTPVRIQPSRLMLQSLTWPDLNAKLFHLCEGASDGWGILD